MNFLCVQKIILLYNMLIVFFVYFVFWLVPHPKVYWRTMDLWNVLVCMYVIIFFQKAYDSVRREVLCNIFIESGMPMKLVRLIKMRHSITIYRLQESLWFIYEGGLVECLYGVCYPCETSKANENVSKWKLLHCSGRQILVWYISYKEWFERRRRSIAIAFQLCFAVWH
jgi:hypothetical protein